MFFVATVKADGEGEGSGNEQGEGGDGTHRGLLMCHHWEATGYAALFAEAGLTQCHAMPVGLVAQVPAGVGVGDQS